MSRKRPSPRPGDDMREGAQEPDFMSTAVRPRPHAGASSDQATDVLVIFGISGDLARVMTFRSLYRLERRGLLQCPILGVAVDQWSDDDLRAHARAAIEAT